MERKQRTRRFLAGGRAPTILASARLTEEGRPSSPLGSYPEFSADLFWLLCLLSLPKKPNTASTSKRNFTRVAFTGLEGGCEAAELEAGVGWWGFEGVGSSGASKRSSPWGDGWQGAPHPSGRQGPIQIAGPLEV